MSIKIKIHDYYNGIKIHYNNIKDYKIYELLTGITVLTGCNGYGKSTTMNEIKHDLKEREIDFCSFDGTTMGASHVKSNAIYSGKLKVASMLLNSSEGEGLIISFGEFVEEINKITKECKRIGKPFILFCDAIDSGLSIDKIQVVKHFLFVVLDDLINNGVDAYIITTANTFEMCRSDTVDTRFKDYFRCMDSYKLLNIQFTDYYDYEEFILKTSKIVEERYMESNSNDEGELRSDSMCKHSRRFDQVKEILEGQSYEKE